MRFLLAFLFLASCTVNAISGEPAILKLKKTTVPIVVDGIIDPVWSTADSADGFIQTQPYCGKPSTRRTVAKVLTTDEAMYCLMICYDLGDSIQVIAGKLDDTNGDGCSIYLDTFLDKRTAYRFGVVASGARSDCRMLDDGRNTDYSWDGVWFSRTQVHDWGYVVEWEIPYRSIQYDEKLTGWGLDFNRWITARNEDTYWCRYEENEGQRVSKFGKLVFEDFHPDIKGDNLEFYPVAITRIDYSQEGRYRAEPDAGLDIFYNPSQKLTFQFTANPDFAQIEADPFAFNITRYETYFDERRPFFTQGNEVFMPAGRDRSSGFYRPLELFYSRRIGKSLSDGSVVPLQFGAKVFGRISDWEYGGFLARTGSHDYVEDSERLTESTALFGSMRLKRQILDNSSIGFLFVGKHDTNGDDGVFDIDGAFRSTDWQLAYQLARSFKNRQGDYAVSTGLMMFKEKSLVLVRGRYIGQEFDVNQVGYVPWLGTSELTAIGGPRWYFNNGYIRQILVLGGLSLYNKRMETYTDHSAVLVFNMQFRDNWGYEIDYIVGRSKDQGIAYPSYEIDYSCWLNISSRWYGNISGAYAKTYNFSRDYLGRYFSFNSSFGWHALKVFDAGLSFNTYVEGTPENQIEDITYNARPFFSVTPINDLNVRVYVDNVFIRSTDRMERMILGFLFSYSFLPKSWIYLAINEVRDRSDQFEASGVLLPNSFHVTDRVGVFKVKYLYYY